MVLKNNASSFHAWRINATTFAVTEDDKYHEDPLIYVKIHPELSLVLITDTGCDAPSKRSENAAITHLRPFLEQCPVPLNGGRPLNPEGRGRYVLLITHCHYDHIGGLAQFLDASSHTTTVIASTAGREFITHNLWEHSLCKGLGLPDPTYYRPSIFAADGERLFSCHDGHVVSKMGSAGTEEVALGVTVLNTPGHVPDELAWYDSTERWLYVGDSFYFDAQILFPPGGSIVDYMLSLERMLAFVQSANSDGVPRVRVACGHVTFDEDAEEAIMAVQTFFRRVLNGDLKLEQRGMYHGEMCGLWRDEDVRLALLAPLRLVEDAREVSSVLAGIKSSN